MLKLGLLSVSLANKAARLTDGIQSGANKQRTWARWFEHQLEGPRRRWF